MLFIKLFILPMFFILSLSLSLSLSIHISHTHYLFVLASLFYSFYYLSFLRSFHFRLILTSLHLNHFTRTHTNPYSYYAHSLSYTHIRLSIVSAYPNQAKTRIQHVVGNLHTLKRERERRRCNLVFEFFCNFRVLNQVQKDADVRLTIFETHTDNKLPCC